MSHILNLSHYNFPRPKDPTFQTSDITNISPPEHLTFGTSHIPNILYAEHPTS